MASIVPATIDFLPPLNTIMAYMGEKPPLWAKVREEVATFFNVTIPPFAIRGRVLHDVIFQSPSLLHPCQAEIVLMGDFHYSSAAKRANAEGIDSLIAAPSLLLCESMAPASSEPPLPVRELHLTTHLISSYARNLLQVRGWDYFNHLGISEEERVRMMGREYADPYTMCAMEDLLALVPRIRRGEITDPVFLQKMGDQLTKFKAKIPDLQPLRTETMIGSLRRSAEMVRRGEVKKVVCIAGNAHLEEPSSDPRMSLAALYDFLSTTSALVVTPKDTPPDVGTPDWHALQRGQLSRKISR